MVEAGKEKTLPEDMFLVKSSEGVNVWQRLAPVIHI